MNIYGTWQIKMWHKIQKYWYDFSPILTIVIVLDPQYKFELVEFCYKKIYGNDSLEFELLCDKLLSLFKKYKSKLDRYVSSSTSQKGKNKKHEEAYTMDVNVELS